MSSKFNVENDDYCKNFIDKPSRNENTVKNIKKYLENYTKQQAVLSKILSQHVSMNRT